MLSSFLEDMPELMLHRMRGIVPDDILDALKKKKLGLPGIDIEVQEERNAMQMGEFEVIKELLAAYPAAKVAKAQVTASYPLHYSIFGIESPPARFNPNPCGWGRI